MHVLISAVVIGVAGLISVAACLAALQWAKMAHRRSVTCMTLQSELAAELRKQRQNELRVIELADLCERTRESMHKLRSRVGMKELRERSDAAPQLNGAAWKDQQRKQLGLSIITPLAKSKRNAPSTAQES